MPGFRKKSRRNRSNRRNVKKRQSRRNRTNGGRRYRHRGGMEQGAPGGTDTTQTETTFTPTLLEATTKIEMTNSKTGATTIYDTFTDKNGKIQIKSKQGQPASEGVPEVDTTTINKTGEEGKEDQSGEGE